MPTSQDKKLVRLEYIRQWRKDNPDKVKATIKRYRDNHPEYIEKEKERDKTPERKKYFAVWQRTQIKKLKNELYNLLGGKCQKCGYVGIALQIDHVHGGGTKQRRNLGWGFTYYKQILEKIKSGSKDYQLLCANCNWEKRGIEIGHKY